MEREVGLFRGDEAMRRHSHEEHNALIVRVTCHKSKRDFLALSCSHLFAFLSALLHVMVFAMFWCSRRPSPDVSTLTRDFPASGMIRNKLLFLIHYLLCGILLQQQKPDYGRQQDYIFYIPLLCPNRTFGY
jgi:hypothetical protein